MKLTIISKQGKEAAIAILGAGDFLGEACLTGQRLRMASATAIVPSSILKIEKHEMLRVLLEERARSGFFISYLLSRNMRIEEDLVDQHFNSSEKRLARTLLLLASCGKEGKPDTVVPEIGGGNCEFAVRRCKSMKLSFRNLFMKKLTRSRVTPIISARVP